MFHISKWTFCFLVSFNSLLYHKLQGFIHILSLLKFLDRLLLNFKFLNNTCKRHKFSGLTRDTHHLKDEKDLHFLKNTDNWGNNTKFICQIFSPLLTSSASLPLIFCFTENCSDFLFPLLSTSRHKISTNLGQVLLVIRAKSPTQSCDGHVGMVVLNQHWTEEEHKVPLMSIIKKLFVVVVFVLEEFVQ